MTKKEQKFIATVWEYYQNHGRHDLPWRKTHDPYRILVSEVMLQQTQVERVIPKYRAFLRQFPTVRVLADAPLGDVLRVWQGLGYNRRAKMLHECAREVVRTYTGMVPSDVSLLHKLPGVGPYTAGAVMAFAFNQATPIIETNIRSVYLHHFFSDETDISDRELLSVVDRTLDRGKSREWYYALMDYGAYLKKEHGNPNVRGLHHTRQSQFKGSDRQIRGAIIRFLTRTGVTRTKLHKELPFEDLRIDAQLTALAEEGMIVCFGGRYRLP